MLVLVHMEVVDVHAIVVVSRTAHCALRGVEMYIYSDSSDERPYSH